jgi:hypothetical protein
MTPLKPLEVGTWLRPYVRVDAVDVAGDGFDGYVVLHGDCVPKSLVLRRYWGRGESVDVIAMARAAELYDVRREGGVIEVIGERRNVEAFHRAFMKAADPNLP